MEIWAITNGHRGFDTLVKGVAQAIGGEMWLIHTHLKPPWSWLAPYRAAEIAARNDPNIVPPWPDLVLASGRKAAPYARFIGRASAGKSFTVYLQHPQIASRHFDFVWAPAHDGLSGTNTLATTLSPHGLTAAGLASAATDWRAHILDSKMLDSKMKDKKHATGKNVAVMIGGFNSAYRFDAAAMGQLADQLHALADQRHYLMVTLSRRTPPAFAALLTDRLSAYPHYLYSGAGENPYQAILGLADHLLVTCDSVNMVGEACMPGKPVQIIGLPGGSAKFNRFHAAVEKAGFVRRFNGTLETWDTQPQNATPAIATAIKAAMATKEVTKRAAKNSE